MNKEQILQAANVGAFTNKFLSRAERKLADELVAEGKLTTTQLDKPKRTQYSIAK